MPSFFEKRDPWGNGYALWVLVVMAFLIPLACWQVSQVRLENNVKNWLPQGDPQAKTLKWYESLFPSEQRLIVSWDGSHLSDPRVAALERELEGETDSDGQHVGRHDYVSAVISPRDMIGRITQGLSESYLKGAADKDKAFEDLRSEVLRRTRGVLVGPGLLRVRLTAAGREQQTEVLAELASRAHEELGLELEFFDPFDPAAALPPEWRHTADAESGAASDVNDLQPVDSQEALLSGDAPDAKTEALVDRIMQVEPQPHDFQVSWPMMHPSAPEVAQFRELAESLRGARSEAQPKGLPLVEDAFFETGSPVALIVAFSETGKHYRTETLDMIRAAAARVGVPEAELRLGGQPLVGSELNRAVERVGWNAQYPGWQFWKRSPFLFSLAVGVLLTILMLRNVRLSLLVIGCAIYVMLMASALVPASGGSMNMVLVVMPTLLMVLAISAAVHVANYWKHGAARYPGNRVRAVSAAERMARVPCYLASLTTAIGLASLATSSLVPVRDFGLYSAVGCVVCLLVVLYGFPSLLQYFPAKPVKEEDVDRPVWRALGLWLYRHRVAVPVACLTLFVVCSIGLIHFRTETKAIRYFPETSRVIQDYNALEQKLSGIVPVDVLVLFEPDARDATRVDSDGDARPLPVLERLEVVRRIEEKMREHPEISGTISLADFQPVSESPDKLGALATRNYNYKNRRVEEAIRKPDSAARSFYRVVDSNTEFASQGDEAWKITAQVAVMSDMNYGELTAQLDEIVSSVTQYHPGVRHVITGMVPVFLRTQQALLESLIISFGLAFAVIAVLMMLLLKSFRGGLITMLPNLLPVGVVFGLISWSGMRVDIGTMITASVALGIAVDGTLHLLTWFRDGLKEGLTREEAVELGLLHCGPAMWQTSLTVGLGLAMLAFADILLVSRFGWLMAALIGMALLADIIFLPALLAGPLGFFIQRSVRKEHARKAAKKARFVPQTTLDTFAMKDAS